MVVSHECLQIKEEDSTGLPFDRFKATVNKLTSEMKKERDKNIGCVSCVGGFSVLMILLIFTALPISELIMGSIYKNQIDCVTEIVNIDTWLIVKGSIGLFVVVFLSILVVAVATEEEYLLRLSVTSTIPFYLSCLFSLAWLIVGSVIFWRDCIDLSPRSVNTMMWCSLIIGYVLIYIQWTTSNKKKKEYNSFI